ncbi:UNVERIFIED_CONTAM: hypothetical protein PYX00_004460 [Menopon gallinae]|uniref:Uncharacterized protein n=1 Tax=Menopon gallinae TaxID=328185 RepID=A0AAW2I4J8_9NEOP
MWCREPPTPDIPAGLVERPIIISQAVGGWCRDRVVDVSAMGRVLVLLSRGGRDVCCLQGRQIPNLLRYDRNGSRTKPVVHRHHRQNCCSLRVRQKDIAAMTAATRDRPRRVGRHDSIPEDSNRRRGDHASVVKDMVIRDKNPGGKAESSRSRYLPETGCWIPKKVTGTKTDSIE